MGQIVKPPYYYDADTRQIRIDIADRAHPIAQVCNWSEDTDPTGVFIVKACNSHDELVAALKRFANLDRSVNSGLWSIRPEYCEEARAILAKLEAA